MLRDRANFNTAMVSSWHQLNTVYSSSWRQLHGQAPASPQHHPWRQLAAAWLFFVVSAGVYHSPSTLLGGRCPNATLPCSLAEEFPDITPAALGWLPSTFLLVKGILALPAGFALERCGTGCCIRVGTVVLLITSALYAAAPAYWSLPLLYAGFGISYCVAGLAPLVVHANGWFDHGNKATSIGLLVTGFSTAGVVWPTLVAVIAQSHGWRVAALVLPGASLVVALPIAICCLRDGPHSSSQRRSNGPGSSGSTRTANVVQVDLELPSTACPDIHRPQPTGAAGGTTAAAEVPRADAGHSVDSKAGATQAATPLSQSWRTDPIVWHLGAMSVWILYIVNAIQHLLVTFLCSEEVGLSLSVAGLYSSLIFALSLVGKVIWGFALDRPRGRLYAPLGCILIAVGGALTLRLVWTADGTLEIAAARSHAQLSLFAVTFGLGYGGAFTLVQSRAAQLYGSCADFPLLQSCLAVCQYIGSFLGVLVTSQLRDPDTGSFVRPFLLFPVIGLLNVAHSTQVFRPSH